MLPAYIVMWRASVGEGNASQVYREGCEEIDEEKEEYCTHGLPMMYCYMKW